MTGNNNERKSIRPETFTVSLLLTDQSHEQILFYLTSWSADHGLHDWLIWKILFWQYADPGLYG